MKIEKFEDIEAWIKARILLQEIYRHFADVRDYSIKDQIQRASLSIMSNIAEGFDRGTNKEFLQYLIIARGSASEVRSILYAALDIGYINSTTFINLSEQCLVLTSLINGFIRYLKNSERKR